MTIRRVYDVLVQNEVDPEPVVDALVGRYGNDPSFFWSRSPGIAQVHVRHFLYRKGCAPKYTASVEKRDGRWRWQVIRPNSDSWYEVGWGIAKTRIEGERFCEALVRAEWGAL